MLSGLVAGLAVAPAVGLDGFAEVAPFTITVAGFALAPDIDCPGATASTMGGPITKTLSRGVAGLSGWLYARTKGPRDEDGKGTHRHLSHTLVAVGILAGLAALTSLLHPWVVLAWVTLGTLAAHAARLIRGKALTAMLRAVRHEIRDLWPKTWPRSLRRDVTKTAVFAVRYWPFTIVAASIATALLTAPDPARALSGAQGWIGLAVGLGCVTHIAGDAVTRSGVPFLFPLLIAGETWYEIRLLGPLSFTTGKTVEKVVFWCLAAAAVLLLPGVWRLCWQLGAGLASSWRAAAA